MDFMLLFIPFLALDDKGGVKVSFMYSFGLVSTCIELVSISFRTPLIVVRTMWCENICNVCYSVLRCHICLCSKEFVLVWEFFLWLGDCFSVFWFRRAGYSGLQAGFSGLPDRSLRAPTRSLRVSLADTLFIEWITCHMHHSCFCTHLFTPLLNI